MQNVLIDTTGTDGIHREIRERAAKGERLTTDVKYVASVASVGHRRRFRTFYNLSRAQRWVANALPGEPVIPAGSCKVKTFCASEHRDMLLVLAEDAIRSIAYRRAHKILCQTGTFTVAAEGEDLCSRERFEAALRQMSNPDTLQSRKLRSARRSKTPKLYQTSSAPSEQESVWSGFTPSSAKAKPSLRVDIPNDAPEDVAGEVIADLSAQAPPCGECGRLYSLTEFFQQAEGVCQTPEQRSRLAELRRLADEGRLAEACPMLFHFVGVRPSALPKTGANSAGADEYSCRLLSLAGHYSWRASMRYAYRATRGGAFKEGLRQDRFGEDMQEVESDDRPVWASIDEDLSPEDIVLQKTSDSEYLRRLANACYLITTRSTYAAQLEFVLRKLAEEQVWPTGSEVADWLNCTPRTGRNILSDLAEVILETDEDVRRLAV